jgi:hypothetical protein
MRTVIQTILRLALALGFSTGVASADSPDTAAALEKLTGGRVKVVWHQNVDLAGWRGGEGGDADSIMAFDTADGKTRVLVPGPAKLGGQTAWILPDGESVVYTDLAQRAVNLIAWDGSDKRTLFTDEYCYVLCTLKDPATGHVWIYVSNHHINAQLRPEEFDKARGGDPKPRGDRVFRVRLDNPGIRELVFDHSPVDLNFRVSGDGRMAASGFPWPRQGLVQLPLGREQLFGQGCNASIAPDASYRFFFMQGNHRFICFYDFGDSLPRIINVQVPNNQGMESWLPRWSNRTPYFTIAGPIAWQGEDRKKTEIWLGQFDPGFTRVQQFVRVTDTPDAWVSGGNAWIENDNSLADPSALPPTVQSLVNQLLGQASFGADLLRLEKDLTQETDPASKAILEQTLAYLKSWAAGTIAQALDHARENPERAREILTELATKLEGHPLAETAQTAMRQIAGAWPVEGPPPAFVWNNARTPVRMPGQQGIFLRPYDGARFQQFSADVTEGWMNAPNSGPTLQAAMQAAPGLRLARRQQLRPHGRRRSPAGPATHDE